MVRSASKLTDALKTTHDLSQETLDNNLTIVEGDIRDKEAVKRALVAKGGRVADIVITGIGAYGKLQWSITTPITMRDLTLCQDGAKTVVSGLRELRAEGFSGAPLVVAISTTGISQTRDVPYLMYPLYHWLLHVPHEDKKAMEDVFIAAAQDPSNPVDNFVLIRPTLLNDDELKGISKVRVGWERPPHLAGERGPGPAMGYFVGRSDVGNWIYEEVVKNGQKWAGKCVSLTY